MCTGLDRAPPKREESLAHRDGRSSMMRAGQVDETVDEHRQERDHRPAAPTSRRLKTTEQLRGSRS